MKNNNNRKNRIKHRKNKEKLMIPFKNNNKKKI